MFRFAVLLLLLLVIPLPLVPAALRVQGDLTTAGVTGRTHQPHGWFEEVAYISPALGGTGDASYTGSQSRGYYEFLIPGLFPAGEYTIFCLKFDGAAPFDYRTGVQVPGGASITVADLQTRADYSVMYNNAWTEWSQSPWVWGQDFYQTYTATSPHPIRAGTRLVRINPGVRYIRLALYKTNAGPTSSWTRISPIRSRHVEGADPIHPFILWVPFRSSETAQAVGEQHALRIWCDDGEGTEFHFGLFARPDRGDGYAAGQLYVHGAPHPGWDAYGYVSGGGDGGALVNHVAVHDLQLTTMLGYHTRSGQTFRATGTGLAAVELPYATGHWEVNALTFQLYDGVGGNPIGPANTCYGAPGPFQFRAGAFWGRGLAPTVPGQIYYLEITSPTGFNTWRMLDDLPDVNAYVNRVSVGATDMMLTIAEWDVIASPTATPTATPTAAKPSMLELR